jgi:predicted DNA-binding transcriptional regulator YafY
MIGKSDKYFQLLEMNDRLSKGESIIKSHILAEFGIPSKTFQRDINSLKQYYSEKSLGELIYDRKQDCYRSTNRLLTRGERVRSGSATRTGISLISEPYRMENKPCYNSHH